MKVSRSALLAWGKTAVGEGLPETYTFVSALPRILSSASAALPYITASIWHPGKACWGPVLLCRRSQARCQCAFRPEQTRAGSYGSEAAGYPLVAPTAT